MARSHRRGRPKKSALGSLSAAARRAVRVGAAVLRLAESLDRSHGQVVDHVELRDRGERFQLSVRAHGPMELERWAAGRQVAAMETLLGKPLVIEPAEPDADAAHGDEARPPSKRGSVRRSVRRGLDTRRRRPLS